MFPVTPRPEEIDNRGLFVCQDPQLRDRILPLFNFDPQKPQVRPFGYGTTFRIDPWSRCATAFHVLEGLFDPEQSVQPVLKLRDDARLVALQIDGIQFGMGRIPEGAWRPIRELFSIFGVEQRPLNLPRLRNFCELAALRIRANTPDRARTPYLSMDLRRWIPKVDEQVLALGFAGLDLDTHASGDDRPIRQYLFGSIAKIITVEPANPTRSRPWPQIRVDKEWPAGMSGGPVFNSAGNVVGLVSAGIEGLGTSSATYFSGWNVPPQIFGSIDPDNPGYFKCYAIFEDTKLIGCGQDESEVRAMVKAENAKDFGTVSVNMETGDYIRLS
jgi:serine protease Do